MEKAFNFREAFEREAQLSARLNTFADKLEGDNAREGLTEAEEKESVEVKRELKGLRMRIEANRRSLPTFDYNPANRSREIDEQIRDCVKNKRIFELRIKRDDFGGNMSTYPDAPNGTNPAPLTLGTLLQALYGELILSKIGTPLLTGLTGNYQWPIVETVEASIEGEAVEIGDTKIPISKLTAKPYRIALAIPITREAIAETDGLIQSVCQTDMPKAVGALLNKIMFSTTAVSSTYPLVGPFVNIADTHKVAMAGDTPTFKELLSLKGLVLGEKILPEGLCYVMTETTKAALEATPKFEYGGVPVIDERGTINGIPVFCTPYAEEGAVYFGSFKYAPQGIFGEPSIIVDPYTPARKNAIDFVLNMNYALTTLREEAFAMLTAPTDTGGNSGGNTGGDQP